MSLKEKINSNRSDAEQLAGILDRMMVAIKNETDASLQNLLKHMKEGFRNPSYDRDAELETKKMEMLTRILNAGLEEE
jgi:hypothetical protein